MLLTRYALSLGTGMHAYFCKFGACVHVGTFSSDGTSGERSRLDERRVAGRFPERGACECTMVSTRTGAPKGPNFS